MHAYKVETLVDECLLAFSSLRRRKPAKLYLHLTLSTVIDEANEQIQIHSVCIYIYRYIHD